MLQRYYDDKIAASLAPGKVLVLLGPRQVGKTTLINTFLETYSGRYYSGVGEDRAVREVFESEDLQRIKSSFIGYDLVVIDEAQKIQRVGTGLKLLVDHLPEVKVLASGSSSFELPNRLGEPLTGRQKVITLSPLAVLELKEIYGPMHVKEMISELLVYGNYPEALTLPNYRQKREYLANLRDSYLYRDILELENVRNSRKLSDLLTLLAFQIGREVSLNELSMSLGIAIQTVERYLDLLEKSFVILRVSGFSRNLRKEVTKTCRYFFLDNGVRNAVINNFNDVGSRDDVGQLWENFLFMERLKKRSYHEIFANCYFWRTYDRKEIDLVEERDGKLYGYEFKWSDKKMKVPKLWLETYQNAEFLHVTRGNFLEFVT